MRRKLSRSLRKVRLAPELESQRKARTLVGRERTQFRRSSHSSSRNASSSSSNSLDREEIKFGQIDLHPYERRCSLRTNDPEALLHKILHGIPEASVRINGGEAGGQEASHYSDPENWIPEAVGLAPNMMKTETKSSGVVKVYDNTSGEFYLSTKEDAVEQYKKGSDLIVECSGYTRQDVIFFSKFLQINAVLCWELLTKYTPDKYQKFGQKCSFYAINNTSNIESLKAKNMPIKILRIPRMLVLFTMSGIPLRDIVPATVKIISPDILIYLILQHDTAQCEEILSELKILVQKTYNASFNTDSLRQRYDLQIPPFRSDFVKNTGEVSSLLLSIKERIEYKKSLLNEMVHDRTSDSIFRV